MDVEAVVLTGGASTRMGRDKAEIVLGNVPLVNLICGSLLNIGIEVTVLGRKPVEGYAFRQDEKESQGPLAAIGHFRPTFPFVFVAACDLILWDVRIVPILRHKIAQHDAAVPTVGGKLQPLCALYTSTALERATDLIKRGERRVVAWLNSLAVLQVTERELAEAGLDPDSVLGANTPNELEAMLRRRL